MSAAPEIAAQARAWKRKCIVSSDYPRLRYLLEEETPVFGRDEEDDEDDWGGYSDLLRADVAIDFLREAANHYPHPSGGALLDAALAELVPHIGRWRLDGVTAEAVDLDIAGDIIRKILEDPDALLG